MEQKAEFMHFQISERPAFTIQKIKMAIPLLDEDWSDYDNRKIAGNKDPRFFSCEERWETDYLTHKIRKKINRADWEIRQAIADCCEAAPGNKPRKEFVECVLAKLKRQPRA